MKRLNKKLNKLKNEKGFSLMETLIAFLVTSLFVGILISVSILGMSKTTYINNDSEIIHFEQGVVKWIENDYRENRIKSINIEEQEGTCKDFLNVEDDTEESIWTGNDGDKLEFNMGTKGSIVFENKLNGFYRTEYKNKSTDGNVVLNEKGNSILITEEPVKCIRYDKENRILEMYFNIYSETYDGFKKGIKLRLVK